MYEYIPEEIKALKNWVCWKAVPDPKPDRPDHISKIPINPYTGGQAQSNNPETWSDFDTAVSCSRRFSGIGFIFNNSGYFGVDLDGKTDALKAFEGGDDNNIIGEFIHTLQSYTEKSQSGTGIHIICKGSLPKGGRRSDKNGVEMYESGRFFVMTGNICAEYAEITDGTEAIKGLHEKYIGGGREPQQRREISSAPCSLSVSEALEAARRSKQGAMFSDLYAGRFENYFKSQSEADLSLCNMLSFWLGADPDKIDEAFRASGLYRDKWDRRQSGSTYGRITIKKAVDSTREVYNPKGGSESYSISINGSSEKPVLHTMDDMGNALRIMDKFGEKIRYNHVERRWMYYDERRWCYDDTGTIYRIADSAIDDMKKEYAYYLSENGAEDDITKAFEKHMKASRSRKSKKNMVEELQHHVPILPSSLDRYKTVVNAPNGMIDLKTGELLPHDPQKYITKILSAEYTDHADCPQWQSFLSDIFNGDMELIRYVQKAVGYCLTGSTAEQCVFFLYGTGRNGKSTFLEVLRDVFGGYITNIQPETIMVRSSGNGNASSDIARLKGARLVTSVEPNEGMRINEGLLKQLTGDDVVTARKLYSDEFEFKPEFKLWMATNHKPIIRGTDTGIWRRIHLIPFTVQIPPEKVDRRLPFKLRSELPAILRWCVDGCLLWQREGLGMPAAVLNSVNEYRREMDVISTFIDARCVVAEGESISANKLFAEPWFAGTYAVAGTSEGGVAAARFDSQNLQIREKAKLIFSWSCESNYHVEVPRSVLPDDLPVLNVMSLADKYFSSDNSYLDNGAAFGYAREALKNNPNASILLLPQAPHTLLNLPQVHAAAAEILQRVAP